MKHLFTTTILGTCIMSSFSQAASADATAFKNALNTQITAMEKIATLLTQARDRASADTQAPAVNAQCKIANDCQATLRALDNKLSNAEKTKIGNELAERLNAALLMLKPHFERLEKANCYGSASLKAALDSTR